MTESFDVAIAGAGPAGSAVSIALARRGWKVVLLEATRFHRERYGETLPPEVNPLLRTLGLWEALQRSAPLESPGTVSCWGSSIPVEQDFLTNPHGPGWHLDRNRFDAELCRAAQSAGVEFRPGCRVSECAYDGGWWQIGNIRGRALVDAAGRNGLRLGGHSPHIVDDLQFVLALRLCYPNGKPPDLRTFIEAAPSGWWYSAPLPDGSSVAMFFTGRETFDGRSLAPQRFLAGAPHTRDRLAPGRIATSRWLSAASSLRKRVYGDAWISVGDSASSFDPLSGRGIFKALRHATAAAQALDAWFGGEPAALERYQERVHREFGEYVVQRRAFYAAERRWPNELFWRIRQASATP